MGRCRSSIVVAGLAGWLAPGIAATAVSAQTSPQPAAAQPSIAQPLPGGMPLGSPILGGKPRPAGGETAAEGRAGRKRIVRGAGRVRSRFAHTRLIRARFAHAGYEGEPLERPALAGVELVTPIPHPIQPPHFTVPVPAYPFENFTTYFTTPPPPVVCRRVPRDPAAPDPHLIAERTVLCEADNP